MLLVRPQRITSSQQVIELPHDPVPEFSLLVAQSHEQVLPQADPVVSQ